MFRCGFLQITGHASLRPVFAYDTLTSKNHNKFRIVFLNNAPMGHRIVAEAVQLALGKIFPEADPLCYKDVSKMYFGGKELTYFDEVFYCRSLKQ